MRRRRNAVPTYRSDRPFRATDPFEGKPYTRLPMPSKQDAMHVTVKSPLGPDDLLFDAFEGREALSELFEFHIRLYSPDPDIDFKKLLGKNLSICIHTIKKKTSKKTRYLAGIITQVQALPSFVINANNEKLAYYGVTLRPDFWLSTLSKSFRIFLKKKTKVIIETILGEDGVSFTNKVKSAGNEVREYCVQYNESNFDFVSRLMEEEGIFYYFEFGAGGATMILADDNKAATNLGDASMEVVRPDMVDGVTLFNAQNQVVAKKFAAVDCDYMKPATLLKASGSGKSLGGEVYEYPGNFLDSGGASKTGPRRMKEIAGPENLVFGQSGILALQAGGTIKLQKHARTSLNQKYLLTEVQHSIQHRPPQAIPGLARPLRGPQTVYANRFTAMPEDVPFIPLRTTPRPKVYGVQTAVVVGPSGKEIYSDEEGRVFIHFLWDREGKKDGKDSIPVRCMQGWAGGNFGLAFVPRIGMEVLVAFENGDPDRPVIVGCLYNGQNKMPDTVTKEPRIAMLKTLTSPKGKKSNIMSFDDTKEEEKIYFHATKDYELMSEADENQFLVKQDGKDTRTQTHIAKGLLETAIKEGEKKVQIDKGNYSIRLKKGSMTIKLDDGDKVLTLAKGNYTINIQKGKMTVTAKQDIAFKTDANFSVTAKQNIKLKATGDITLDAMNIKEKAKLECKREGLNVSDKATLMLKGEGLTTQYEGKVMGTYAGLTATLDGKVMAVTKGGAMGAVKGAVVALG